MLLLFLPRLWWWHRLCNAIAWEHTIRTQTGAVPEMRSPHVAPQTHWAEQGQNWGVTVAQPTTTAGTSPSSWTAGPHA